MELRQPASDAPPWATVGTLALACFALGLGLAFWGTDDAQTIEGSTGEPSAPSATDLPPEGAPPGEIDRAAVDGGAVHAGAIDGGAPGLDAGAQEAEREADAGQAAIDASRAPDPEPAPSVTGAEEARPGPGAPSRFVRGRVAYLRCEGAVSGGRCPRDEALEDAVWAVLARLPECGLPAAGQADLRLAWEADTPADVLWRDTFADDVVRLDRDRVLACVSAGLTATRPSQPSGRLLVSFRFRME